MQRKDERKSAEQAALEGLLAPYLATADDYPGSPWTRRPLLRDVLTGQRDGTLGGTGALPVLQGAASSGPLCRKLREAAHLPDLLLAEVMGCPVGVIRSWEEGQRSLVMELFDIGGDEVRGIERLYGCIAMYLGLGPDEVERLRGEVAEASAA